MRRPPSPLIGLFPWVGAESFGGVQLSGRLAWAALRQHPNSRLLCYAPEGDRLPWPEAHLARSKLALLPQAAARPAVMALVWHIGLLKLQPFLRGRPRLALYLHGVEAWRRHDPLTRLLLGRVDCFLSNSTYTWQRFVDFYPQLAGRPHTVVPLGLGIPVAPPAEPAGPPVALILGRMERGEDYKGHRELIAAWPAVCAQVPQAELWVAGDGSLRLELERLAAGLPVRFFGAVSETQKQELLAACRCLAMPSRGEGFGLVYLEAMRLGRPCLVSDADAGREVVAPPAAGLAVNPSEPAALAAALAHLLSPGPAWAAWSDQARARYAAHYTAAHFQSRLRAALGLTE